MSYQSAAIPLKKRVLKALGWSVGGQIVSYALRLVSTLIMTRLLAPESYGLLAMAMAVIVIVALLADVGLRQSVIRSHRGDDIRFLDTAFTVQVIRGGILTVVILLVALGLGVLGRLNWLGTETTYSDPLLPWLIGVSALSSLILGFQSMKVFQLDRHLKSDLSVKIEMMVQVITIFVTIIVALPTRSIWAVVVGNLVGNSAHVLLTRYWIPGRSDRFDWDRDALNELVSFGRWILVSSALTGIVINGDRLLLGAVTSPENLGLYAIAFNLTGLAVAIVSRVSGTVSIGAISQVFRSTPERLPLVFGKIRLVTDSSLIASSGFLFFIAQPLVSLLYDKRYADAGPILQILSLSLVFARVTLIQQAYAAVGRSEFSAIVSASAAVALCVCFPIGFHLGGFHGAVIAIALRDALLVPVVWILSARCGLNNFRIEFIALLAWPVGYFAGWILVTVCSVLIRMLV